MARAPASATVSIVKGKQLGETFPDEVIAASRDLYRRIDSMVIPGLSDRISAPRLTDAEVTQLNGLIAAHDPTKKKPKAIPMELFQQRCDAEIPSAWDRLIDWSFNVNTRRDAFLKRWLKGNPVRQDDVQLKTWMASAGVPADAIERIFADPPAD